MQVPNGTESHTYSHVLATLTVLTVFAVLCFLVSQASLSSVVYTFLSTGYHCFHCLIIFDLRCWQNTPISDKPAKIPKKIPL